MPIHATGPISVFIRSSLGIFFPDSNLPVESVEQLRDTVLLLSGHSEQYSRLYCSRRSSVASTFQAVFLDQTRLFREEKR